MTIDINHLHQLHNNGLHENLKSLVSLMLSLPEYSTCHLSEYHDLVRKYQVLVYYADALYEDEYYKKAEVVYLDAIKLNKSIIKSKSKSTAKHKEIINEVEVKYRLFNCYMKMKDPKQARSTLESIPSKQRTPKMNMKLGKLYQQQGMERAAITCFKEVLRFSPYAVDAAINLVKLGVALQEISTLLKSGTTQVSEWLLQYIKGYSLATSNKHGKALQIYKLLELQTLRDNVPLLTAMGKSYFMSGDIQESISCFEKARLRDKYYIAHMDVYAQILEKECKKIELERLAQELTEISQVKTEPWIAMAYYCTSIHQEAKAYDFAEKAHKLDSVNIQAILLKASLLHSLDKHQESITQYREAIRLSPNHLEPYEGLVECYISDEKYKEAINVARNALKTIGLNPRTLTLLAQAFYQDFQTQEKGKAMVNKALSMDPGHLPAVYLYCEILIKDENYKEAADILKKTLEDKETSKLYQLYGDCLKGIGDTQKSLEQYSKALRLDPESRKAIESMENIESNNGSELDISGVGMHSRGYRTSMEDLDTLGNDIQWME